MKTITVANQKGGVGKTTILFHLAMYFAQVGKRVLVIDLDTQANITRTLRLTDANEADADSTQLLTEKINAKALTADTAQGIAFCPAVESLYNVELRTKENEKGDIIQKLCENFRQNIQTASTIASPAYDYAFLDCPPGVTGKMIAALVTSDYIVTPVDMEVYALDGVSRMMQTIQRYQKANKNLKFLGMIPNRMRTQGHYETMRRICKSNPGLLLPCPIGFRDSISEASGNGVPAWKNRKTAARKSGKELIKLATHILNIVEKGTENGKKTAN